MVTVNPLLETAVGKWGFFDRDAFKAALRLGVVTEKASDFVLSFCQENDRARPMGSRDELLQRLRGPRRLYVLQSESPLISKLPLAMLFVKFSTEPVIPDKLADVLSNASMIEDKKAVKAALFFSVGSPWREVAGLQLGKTLVQETKRAILGEFPNVAVMSTMSPALGFRQFLESKGVDTAWILNLTPTSPIDAAKADKIRKLAREYVFEAKHSNVPINAMTHFHCSNGAMVYRVNWPADFSRHGLEHSAGLMVNYRYDVRDEMLQRRALAYEQTRKVPEWRDE